MVGWCQVPRPPEKRAGKLVESSITRSRIDRFGWSLSLARWRTMGLRRQAASSGNAALILTFIVYVYDIKWYCYIIEKSLSVWCFHQSSEYTICWSIWRLTTDPLTHDLWPMTDSHLFLLMYMMLRNLRSHPRSCTVRMTTSLGLRVPCNSVQRTFTLVHRIDNY